MVVEHQTGPDQSTCLEVNMAIAVNATIPPSGKDCQGCGILFFKPHSMHLSKWARRAYCGVNCARANSRLRDARQRFEEKVDRSPGRGPGGDCHTWQACRDKKGYGRFQMWTKADLAHRVAYFFASGINPEDSFVCHRCDNPSCVNPAHLWLGDHGDNMTDMASKGRAKPQFGERHTSAKLTDKDVRAIRADNRSGAAIARDYGVTDVMILRIKAGKSWKHVI